MTIEIFAVNDAPEETLGYRDVLSDEQRFIFECLFNIGLRTDQRRRLTIPEMAEDRELPLRQMYEDYHEIVETLYDAGILDSALES